MFQKVRTPEDIKQEYLEINQAIQTLFNVPFDKAKLISEVDEIIGQKIKNYLHERLRDWRTIDLIDLVHIAHDDSGLIIQAPPCDPKPVKETVTEPVKQQEPVKQPEPTPAPAIIIRRRGRPPKTKVD